MSLDDKIKNAAIQALRAQAAKINQRIVSQQSGPGFTGFNNNGQCTGPNGETLNVINVGNPSLIDAAVKINTDTAAFVEESFQQLFLDGGSVNPYIILQDLSNVYSMIQGTGTVHPIDTSGLPTLPPYTAPVCVFSINDKAILLAYLNFNQTTGVFDPQTPATLYWSIVNNFKLVNGVWTGTITGGTVNVDLSGLPKPAQPPPLNPDTSHVYSGPSITPGTALVYLIPNGANGSYNQNPIFYFDNAGKPHIVLAGLFLSESKNAQLFTNPNPIYNTTIIPTNNINGRCILDVNLSTGLTSTSYIIDGTSTWNPANSINGGNHPSFLTGYYLNGGTQLSMFRNSIGLYASAGYITAIVNGLSGTHYFWSQSALAPWPTIVESVVPSVFTDTQFFVDNAVFGNPIGVKAINSNSFLAITADNLITYSKNNVGAWVASGSYKVTNPASVSNFFNLSDRRDGGGRGGGGGTSYSAIDWAVI